MDVEIYETATGTNHIELFINDMGKNKSKLKARVIRAIEILEEFGSNTGEPVSKYLENGILELRAGVGKDAARILYFFHDGKAVSSHGFYKKTQKTPRNEIEKALNNRKDYIART
jgi:phage-related protein